MDERESWPESSGAMREKARERKREIYKADTLCVFYRRRGKCFGMWTRLYGAFSAGMS